MAATPRITPALFAEASAATRPLIILTLALIIAVGFGFRVTRLGAEGLSEDELNKLQAVGEYRMHGLTSTNGEHPMLMKALLTVSVVIAEGWNRSAFAETGGATISTEAALRLPVAVFGAATALLIFLVTAELFGTATGLLAAALWALDPAAIGFNRISKEDSFVVFFFLLANVFWLRSQRLAETESGRPEPLYWATAAAFGLMMASKYLPHLMSISGAYYYAFQGIPQVKWRMGKRRWLIFFAVLGAVFLLANPTILLPGTWQEMRVFASERRIGHDGYEFMNRLYPNQMTLWLRGSPWYFYYVFLAVKLPLLTVAAFIAGLPQLFRRQLGDGRLFLLFWLFFWFFPFTVLGGKFTRYFTIALPAVLIIAAIGIRITAQALSSLTRRLFGYFSSNDQFTTWTRRALVMMVVISSTFASASVSPHFRLYTNQLGGGTASAGIYFPHDEFYDATLRDAVIYIAGYARAGARVASETPPLVAYYARIAGRADLVPVSLSDSAAVRELTSGDFVIVARGRRYFSNDKLIRNLQMSSRPVSNLTLNQVHAMSIFLLDEAALDAIQASLRDKE